MLYLATISQRDDNAVVPRKIKTLDEIERMKSKAARFVLDVLDDPDRAEAFQEMSPEEYAAHKHIQIQNSKQCGRKGRAMARPTRDELEARIDDLEDQNQMLNEKLDSICEIAAAEDENDQEEGDEEGDDLSN